jgi:putative methionine-R-sulfoxide reductase with GAF domain
MRVADLPARCFQGVIPSAIATCSRDGTPNVTYLSNIFRLDGDRIALSCQFFNKTKQNVLENPRAVIELYDPVNFEAYRLEVRYDHAEESGPLFDQMALRIDAIASQTGMKGIFRLRSADVYDVVAIERRDGFLDGTELPPAGPERDPRPRSEIRGLQLVSQRASGARDLDDLLHTVLQALDEAFGFSPGMAFVLDETCKKLFVVATHGHPEDSVGAEIAVGEGLVGSVARERKVLRMSGVEAELRYGRAIRAGIQQSSGRRGLSPEIPLAGLPDAQSHMAMPLVIGDRLLGVLAVESRERLAFDEWHEAFLEIVGNQVAVVIDNALLREREEETDEPPPKSEARPPIATEKVKALRFFDGEDCLFVDGEYLIRNVPARILWRILRAYVDEGRTEFTNRELRLDPFIGLPAVRDNFESRFVLLRRRLEQKCPELRLISTGRGRFRFEADCRITLEERS